MYPLYCMYVLVVGRNYTLLSSTLLPDPEYTRRIPNPQRRGKGNRNGLCKEKERRGEKNGPELTHSTQAGYVLVQYPQDTPEKRQNRVLGPARSAPLSSAPPHNHTTNTPHTPHTYVPPPVSGRE